MFGKGKTCSVCCSPVAIIVLGALILLNDLYKTVGWVSFWAIILIISGLWHGWAAKK